METTHSHESAGETSQPSLEDVLQELDGQLVKLKYQYKGSEPVEKIGYLIHDPQMKAVKLHVATNSETGSKTYANVTYRELLSVAPQWNPIWRKEE